jgi:hypothetical protein
MLRSSHPDRSGCGGGEDVSIGRAAQRPALTDVQPIGTAAGFQQMLQGVQVRVSGKISRRSKGMDTWHEVQVP